MTVFNDVILWPYMFQDAAEMSLADALRELEASTALLQVPYEASSAQSCQSLQCSSGYGTLTNVSSTSAETVASFPAGKLCCFRENFISFLNSSEISG